MLLCHLAELWPLNREHFKPTHIALFAVQVNCPVVRAATARISKLHAHTSTLATGRQFLVF